MKKYILILLATFLVGGVVYAFQPATLFIETWEGLKRVAVHTQEEANDLFSQGYELEQEQLLGTSVTTIAGTDALSNFPTTYNANLAAMNAGKMEISTTSLPLITTLSGLTTANSLTSASSLTTVGALSSGSLASGFTAVTVPLGGTGSTTLSLGQILLGSSTNAVATVRGFGTSGQFLTSNGIGLAPTWQSSSVNQADDYTWTGTHSFAATSTFTANILSNTDLVAMTASTTITGWTLPQPVYIASSTNAEAGGILIVDGNATNTLEFIGFAVTSAAEGETVYIQTNGIVDGFTGLTLGAKYYISDTVGVLSTSVGTFEVLVGTAISATKILIQRGYDEYMGTMYVSNNSSVYVHPSAKKLLIYSHTTDVGAVGIQSRLVTTLTKNGITTALVGIRAGDTGSQDVASFVTFTWSGNTLTTDNGGLTGEAAIYMYR